MYTKYNKNTSTLYLKFWNISYIMVTYCLYTVFILIMLFILIIYYFSYSLIKINNNRWETF